MHRNAATLCFAAAVMRAFTPPMKRQIVRKRSGEELLLYQADSGSYCCPACGAELVEPPYSEFGASYEICACGFEFGYDDSPTATKSAVDGIRNNWIRWRNALIAESATSMEALRDLDQQLGNIQTA
jgi:hypothetical protein